MDMQTVTIDWRGQMKRIEDSDQLVDAAVVRVSAWMKVDHYPARIQPKLLAELHWTDKVRLLRRVATLVASYERSSIHTRAAAYALRRAVDRLAKDVATLELIEAARGL